jgi:hypothetical protein
MAHDVSPVNCLRASPVSFWAQPDNYLRMWFMDPRYAVELRRQCITDDEALKNIVNRRLLPRIVHGVWLSVKLGIDTPEQQRGYDTSTTGRPLSAYETFMNQMTIKRTGPYTHVELCFHVTDLTVDRNYMFTGESKQGYERLLVSLKTGVVRRPIESHASYISGYSTKRLFIPAHRQFGMYLFLMLQETKPFDRAGYFLNHTPLLNRLMGQTTLDQNRWLCSELTAVALQLGDEKYAFLDPKRCSPSQVYAAVMALDDDISLSPMSALAQQEQAEAGRSPYGLSAHTIAAAAAMPSIYNARQPLMAELL